MPEVLVKRSPQLLAAGDDGALLEAFWTALFEEVDGDLKTFEYEGATGTVVLLWRLPGSGRLVLQAANVGDSTAFLVRGGEALALTEDHKPTLASERRRIQGMGIHLEEGQSRLNGLAVSRAFGDAFAKEMQCGMVVTPFVSPLYTLTEADTHVLVASDGLWDVVSGSRAADLAVALGEAEVAAKKLLKTAVDSSKCTDNVTVIVARL